MGAPGAAASMDHRDRRLSVSKSSQISKPSSAPRPPSSSSSSAASLRPPDTVVSADLNNFRRVVQQLTGTPPRSASSSPLRESTPSRLKRIAPPRLRALLHHQNQQNQLPLDQQQHHHHLMPNLPLLQHHHNAEHAARMRGVDQPPQPDFSWLASMGLFSPPLPYTEVANLTPNPDSGFNACINPSQHPNPNWQLLSPHRLVSVLPARSPIDSLWPNILHALPSPTVPLPNSAGPLPPLLPLPSLRGEDLENGSDRSGHEASEWLALSVPSPNGYPLLPSPSTRHPLRLSTSNGHRLLPPSPNGGSLLPSPSNGRMPMAGGFSGWSRLLSSSPSTEPSLLGPAPKGDPLLPSPHAVLPPFSPSTWLPPWPPSPLLPIPFSPGLGPLPSPGLSSFISSPRGFSFFGGNDYQSKPP